MQPEKRENKQINVKNTKILAERGFDPRTSGLWAQHASTAPLCFRWHGWQRLFQKCLR